MFFHIFRFTLLWITLSFVIIESNGDENILLYKPVLSIIGKVAGRRYLNDDRDYSCLEFGVEDKKLVVFDLGIIYKINKIVVTNGDYRSEKPAYFYLGDEYQPCKLQKLIYDYKFCNEFRQTNTTTEITCKPSSDEGRYLVLAKGNAFQYESNEPLNLCEIRVYGVATAEIVIPRRPDIQNETLPDISKSNFKIAPIIRKDVPTLNIPYYSSAVIFVNKNCESIIYDNITQFTFGAACATEDGKGRIVAFAKYGYFEEIFSNPSMSQFKSNLQSWLSPNVQNASYVVSSTIKTMDDFNRLIKPGTIVYFEVIESYSDEIVDNLKWNLLNGTISIAIDLTVWYTPTELARKHFMKFFNIFNIDFYMTYVTWSTPIAAPMPDSYYQDDIVGLEDKLSRVLLSHSYFFTQFTYLGNVISQYPISLLQNTKVAAYFKQILDKYQDLLEWICPCELQPADNTMDKGLIRILGEIMKSQLLANSGYKAPCVDLFPGDFGSPPPKNNATLNVIGMISNTKNPIGYYLEPGATLRYSVSESSGTWKMNVGCHSDNLPDDISGGWYRYPNVYTGDIPIISTGEVFSPFGGTLFLTNDAANTSITLTIYNVIKTPFFNLRDNNAVSNWESQRYNPGLWSIVAGDSIVFCEASNRISEFSGQELSDLLTKTWDPVVRLEMAMTARDWKTERPEMTVLDIMISYGYGHNGYPIEVYPSWHNTIFNATYIQQFGSWGMCHEIGHNLQRSKWTFTGTLDVTNNLLCLLVFDKLFKLPRYGLDANNLVDYKGRISSYLYRKSVFTQWQNDYWIALSIYAQLVHNFGWGFYKKAFEYYETNNIDPSEDDLIINTFINVSCIITGQNLAPIFDFWGFPTDANLVSELQALPCFFPENDHFSALSSIRTDYIKNKYPNCATTSKYYLDFSPELDQPNRNNFIYEL